jgi:hypothetical protein
MRTAETVLNIIRDRGKLSKLVAGEPRDTEIGQARLCDQRRLACSTGNSPVGVKARSPVAKIAGWRETEILKPIDKVI